MDSSESRAVTMMTALFLSAPAQSGELPTETKFRTEAMVQTIKTAAVTLWDI